MIISIIMFSLLAIGIFAWVWRGITGHFYEKWGEIKKKHKPKLDEYTYSSQHGFQYLANPDHNKELYEKAEKKRAFWKKLWVDWDEAWIGTGIIGCLIGGIGTLICFCLIWTSNWGIHPKLEYEMMLEERTNIVKTLENEEGYNSLIFDKVTNFNNRLKEVKTYYKNPWTSWLNNPLIAEGIDYIVYLEEG